MRVVDLVLKNTLLYLAIFLIFLSTAVATDIRIGVGGNFNQFSLSDSLAISNSVYTGVGLTGELRTSISLTSQSSTMEGGEGALLDVFGLFQADIPKRTAGSQAEELFHIGYGGGIDLKFAGAFLGAQFLINRGIIEILSSGQKLDLDYAGLGMRVGYEFNLSEKFLLSVTGIYSTAILSTADNPFLEPRSFNRISSLLILQYRFLDFGGSPFEL